MSAEIPSSLITSVVGPHILRIKGIRNVEGEAQPIAIHGVQHIFHPPAWPSDDRRSRLVFITRDIESKVIERPFEALRQALAHVREPIA